MINEPKNLTKPLHDKVLFDLREVLVNLKEKDVKNPGVMSMRVRNWLFLIEEGQPVVDIIVDKGYSFADVKADIVPRHAETSLSFDECMEYHEYLLSTNVLDSFADEVNVRVGTPGSEPTLHDVEDFEATVGDVVRVETWEKIEGRCKYTMVLNEICDNKGLKVIVLAEGAQRFEILLDNIKAAFALPYHPLSKSLKMAKDAARQKARRGAFKKLK
ncbi:Ribosome maturation factor RimP [Spirobacillus cienkowskii]